MRQHHSLRQTRRAAAEGKSDQILPRVPVEILRETFAVVLQESGVRPEAGSFSQHDDVLGGITRG